MFLNVAIFAGVLATAAILLSPRLSRLPLWRAVITPLASIIGSGFLILGPLLDDAYGYLAPAVMAALCLAAFAFGWVPWRSVIFMAGFLSCFVMIIASFF